MNKFEWISPVAVCIICKDGGGLTIGTEKGVCQLVAAAKSKNDERVLSSVPNKRNVHYHSTCYKDYTRKRKYLSPDDQEPLVKRTRKNHNRIDEKLCIICQRKRWRSPMHTYTGDVMLLAKQCVWENEVFDRIIFGQENNIKVRYHSECLKEMKKYPNLLPSRNFQECVSNDVEESQAKASDQQQHVSSDKTELKTQIVNVAQTLKQEMVELKNSNIDLVVSYAAAEKLVPPLLHLFISSLLPKSATSATMMSLAQDIIYATVHLKTPKHVALATTVRHWTSSRKIVTLLSNLGHCVSYITDIRMETTLAREILKSFETHGVYVPHNLNPSKFMFGAADNIDFSNASPDGKGSVHATNMVIFQNSTDSNSPSVRLVQKPDRPLKVGQDELYGHINPKLSYQKSSGPSHIHEPVFGKLRNAQLVSKSHERNWHWAKLRELRVATHIGVPSWSAFYGRLKGLCPSPHPVTTLAYLPMLNEKPTTMESVGKCLTIMDSTFKQLGQTSTVVIMDQAMYALAMQVVWSNPSVFRDVVLVMGGFHISMNYLGALGKLFGGLGWCDLLEESGLFGERIAMLLVNGKPYSRCVDTHKAVYEVMSHLRFREFRLWCEENEEDVYSLSEADRSTLQQLMAKKALGAQEFSQVTQVVQKHIPTDVFERFMTVRECESANFKFWSNYLKAVDALLTLTAAERTGNWKLYIASLHEMIPIFFSADRPNYSRWLTIHLYEMENLVTTHPEVCQEFIAGNFVVRRSQSSFNAVSPDLALEQSLNKEVKVNGGLVGMNSNDNATDRWFLTNHIRATVSSEIVAMAGETSSTENDRHHTDNKYHQLLSVDWTEKLLAYIDLKNINPFKRCSTSTVNHLITGAQFPERDSARLNSMFVVGRNAHEEFVEQRLISKKVEITKAIPRMKLATTTCGIDTKASSVKNDRKSTVNNLARLTTIVKSRPNEVRLYMSKEFCAYPPTICNDEGTPRKTEKSQLLQALISRTSVSVNRVQDVTSMAETTAICVDAMALIHQLCLRGCETYNDISRRLWNNIVSQMKYANAHRADIVFDSYRDLSIKAAERERRSRAYSVITIQALGKIPPASSWQKFLSVSENKIGLIHYLKSEWKSPDCQAMLSKHDQIVLSGDIPEEAVMVTNHGTSVMIQNLSTNHEEADTKIIVHIKHMISVFDVIFVFCSDTDVAMLLLYFFWKWKKSIKLWMVKGNSAERKMIPIHAMAEKLGDVCLSLPGLHALSGCDSIHAMFGISKSKMLQAVSKNNFWPEIDTLGEDLTHDGSTLKKVIYHLYGRGGHDGTLNELRYKLLAEKGYMWEKLPLTDAAFIQHIARVNYQTWIWKQADRPTVDPPNPCEHGWRKEDGKLIPEYPSTSEEKASLITCKCKGQCSNLRCICRRSNLSCTDACQCGTDCINDRHDDIGVTV